MNSVRLKLFLRFLFHFSLFRKHRTILLVVQRSTWPCADDATYRLRYRQCLPSQTRWRQLTLPLNDILRKRFCRHRPFENKIWFLCTTADKDTFHIWERNKSHDHRNANFVLLEVYCSPWNFRKLISFISSFLSGWFSWLGSLHKIYCSSGKSMSELLKFIKHHEFITCLAKGPGGSAACERQEQSVRDPLIAGHWTTLN